MDLETVHYREEEFHDLIDIDVCANLACLLFGAERVGRDAPAIRIASRDVFVGGMTGRERFADENTEQLDNLAPRLVELDEPLQTLEKRLSLSLELRQSLGVDSVALGEDCEQQIVLRAEVMQQPWSSHLHLGTNRL